MSIIWYNFPKSDLYKVFYPSMYPDGPVWTHKEEFKFLWLVMNDSLDNWRISLMAGGWYLLLDLKILLPHKCQFLIKTHPHCTTHTQSENTLIILKEYHREYIPLLNRTNRSTKLNLYKRVTFKSLLKDSHYAPLYCPLTKALY